MDERERKKLEEKIKKGALLSVKERPQQTRLRRVFGLTNLLWGFALAAITVLGGWAVVRPHVSVEPLIPLNPVDPYSTQFTVKNENSLFKVHDINCVCWPRKMESGNGFSVISPGVLPNIRHEIRVLEPDASSTVDCPALIGGLPSYSGRVLYAELEIVVSY